MLIFLAQYSHVAVIILFFYKTNKDEHKGNLFTSEYKHELFKFILKILGFIVRAQ